MKSNEKIRSVLEDLCYIPEATLSPNSLVFQNMDTSFLLITNRSTKDKAIYKIVFDLYKIFFLVFFVLVP